MAASTKSFLADAGYGEQELDANSALMELDKGEPARARRCRRPGQRGRGGGLAWYRFIRGGGRRKDLELEVPAVIPAVYFRP